MLLLQRAQHSKNNFPPVCQARGLIRFCWKKPKPPSFTFNTRGEEAASKPMWREVVKTSRCMIPAVGWYEWEEVKVTDPATGEIKKTK